MEVLLRKSKDSLLISTKNFAEVSTKIANKLSARLSEINSTFIVELKRINNKLNGKLITEIKKINSCDADYASETQRVLLIVNNIKEACHNNFASVNASIEALQNGLIQCYTINRRIQPAKTDQQSVSNHFAEVRLTQAQ